MEETDLDTQTQMILLAASNHDVETLRTLLRTGSANVQDPDTGFTPLHAAIAACELDGHVTATAEQTINGGPVNGSLGNKEDETTASEDMENAKKTLKLLFQNGAIWNDLDCNNETPGCLAWRLGLEELYDMMVDAGVRAELLLNRLDEYAPLAGEDGTDEGDDEGDGKGLTDSRLENAPMELEVSQGTVNGDGRADTSVNGGPQEPQQEVTSAKYLSSELTFHEDKILDGDANGVMMAWEMDIMKRSAELLLPKEGLRVLNVGHGMGLIDQLLQSKAPIEHHIIEAHPGVLRKMRTEGWYDKPNVIVHEGKWQDVVVNLIEQGKMFDAIYFDTFAEDYKALREFFTEHVIGLLDPSGGAEGEGGRFGFFNGLSADRQVCYDVYAKVVEMDLFEAGFDTEWETLKVPDLHQSAQWDGVRREYWVLDTYKLPTCKFIG